MAQQQLPEYERTETINENVSLPSASSAVRELADAEFSNLSSIGAQVAQTASTKIAENLGYEMGQTPKGDLFPPITDFDKHVVDSYNAQAASTLSLQANQLFADTSVQLAQAPRLTPELVGNAHNQLAQGLSDILDNAPNEIKGKLEYSFQNQLLNTSNDYQLKMVGQQREQQSDDLNTYLEQNKDLAFDMAAKGDHEGAQALAEDSRQVAMNGVNNNLISREKAYVNVQTIKDSARNGKYIHEALQAKQANKFEEWEENFAKNKPKDLSFREWNEVGNAVTSYMGTLDNMRAQEENIRAAKMMNSIATNVNAITGGMLQEFKENVDPLKYEQVKLKYINAIKSSQQNNAIVNELVRQPSNAEVFARSTEGQKDKAFDSLTDAYVQQRSQAPYRPISREEAEVQIAAQFPGRIPVFTNSLNTRASSGNPSYIESAAQQVHALREMGAGHALTGLSNESNALFSKYEALRQSLDPVTAAKMATDTVYNQTPEQQENNKKTWSHVVDTFSKGGKLATDTMLKQVGLSKESFLTPSLAHVYGTDILNTYNTYYDLLNGDKVAALKNVNRVVKENYGETGVNGKSFTTLHPLEKVLGYEDKGVVPFIQADIESFLNKSFLPQKEMYQQKKINEYWEVAPRKEAPSKSFSIMQPWKVSNEYEPIQVHRVTRVGNKEVKEKMNVVVQGNAFNQWDISVNSNSGLRPIFQVAPYLGITTYIPNKKAIDEAYNAAHPL